MDENQTQKDDPALLDALVSSYSILSLLHHRGASVDQPAKRTLFGKLTRPIAHGKLVGLDRTDVEEALNKLQPFATAAEQRMMTDR